jgi:hypothetical protein
MVGQTGQSPPLAMSQSSVPFYGANPRKGYQEGEKRQPPARRPAAARAASGPRPPIPPPINHSKFVLNQSAGERLSRRTCSRLLHMGVSPERGCRAGGSGKCTCLFLL